MTHTSLSNIAYAEGPMTAPVYAAVSVAGVQSGATVVAAAGAGKKIRVLSLSISPAAASSTLFKSATTAKTPTFTFAAAGLTQIHSGLGLFETAANEALNVDTGAGAVGLQLTYVVVG